MSKKLKRVPRLSDEDKIRIVDQAIERAWIKPRFRTKDKHFLKSRRVIRGGKDQQAPP